MSVCEDCQGAKYLAKNSVTASCSKHTDISHHLMRESVFTGDIEVSNASAMITACRFYDQGVDPEFFRVSQEFADEYTNINKESS